MGLFGLGKAAAEADLQYLDECQSQIQDRMVCNIFGHSFIPEGSISPLFDGIDLNRLLPGASEGLKRFIRSKAKRVCLITLRTLNCAGPDLVAVFDTFQKNGFTDALLPIGNVLEDRGRGSSRTNSQGSRAVADNPADISFSIKPWSFGTKVAFKENQWRFIAPVFNQSYRKNGSKEIPKNAILPFLERIKLSQGGHFSDVYQVLLLEDHQDKLKKDDGSPGVSVALKELKSQIPGEDRYDVETAWKREADALDQLSELEHPNLIRRIDAFKSCNTYCIMFEWANGGTLREFWINNKNAHFELTGSRIKQVLTQLCGLAEAICMLHNTNPHTSTGLEEIANQKLSFKNKGRRGLDLEGNTGVSNRDRNIFDKSFGNGSASPSDWSNVPEINLPNESHDNMTKHWRHGDIKPENILVATNPSSWLGTLKIADLGLAKQHEFATAVRVEVTSTEHTTLHYEAPEAVTNRTQPRSRRYDIWSMGCIILESVIWLLYGYDGLLEFYRDNKKFKPHGQHTLYFTTETNENGSEIASVSETVTSWITGILENDPECKETTALRELLELVKDRLLVVAISTRETPNAVQFRANAAELHKGISNILSATEYDTKYLFTGRSRKDIKVPWSPRTTQNDASRKKTHRNQEYLGINRSGVNRLLPHRSPQHAMDTYRHADLDDAWDFLRDNEFSVPLMEANGFDMSRAFPEGTQSLCEHCLALDFRSLGLVVREEFYFLELRAGVCTLCNLILELCDASNLFRPDDADAVEIWRVKGGLALHSRGTPVLSIYGTPSAYAGLASQAQPLPVGLPKLATIGSQMYFRLLNRWLEDCDQNHTGCRPTAAELSLFMTPTRLLDVGEKGSLSVHLVETKSWETCQDRCLKYIAVSHPWGEQTEHTHYCTTSSNINSHKAGIPINILPNTFKDAIQVTRELGVRYLWIDSLCIVQGKDGDFSEEAIHMETVFSSAYCVIAATCAKGMSSGFLGARNDRKVIKFEKPGESPLYICEFIDNFQREVIEGPLNQRGWVLQERALARRTIYFADSQTYWECGEGVRCETLARMRNNQADLLGDPKFPKVATESTKGGRIRLYELLYKQYSRLRFTNIYDRPLAIAGIEQRLIRAFDTQGGYGVFTRYFGRGLLWQRDTASAPPGVMEPIRFPRRPQVCRVPSWSWMAYEGAIAFMDLPFGEIDWEERELRSPWDPAHLGLGSSSLSSSRPNNSSNSTWHTADANGGAGLTVIARDFSASADAYLVYDRGDRPDDHIVKCVIVGKRKGMTETDGKRIYYVLIIAREQGRGLNVGYKRIGVGSLPGSLITLEEAGLRVQVL